MIRLLLAIVMVAVVACVMLLPHKHRGKNLVAPITMVNAGWTHMSSTPQRASFTVEGDALRVDIPQVNGDPSNVQCFRYALPVTEGAQYRVTFDAKASHEDVIQLQAIAESKGLPNIGLNTQVPLVTQWVTYNYTFTARDLNGRTAHLPLFLLGTNTGTVWIKNVVVEEL